MRVSCSGVTIFLVSRRRWFVGGEKYMIKKKYRQNEWFLFKRLGLWSTTTNEVTIRQRPCPCSPRNAIPSIIAKKYCYPHRNVAAMICTVQRSPESAIRTVHLCRFFSFAFSPYFFRSRLLLFDWLAAARILCIPIRIILCEATDSTDWKMPCNGTWTLDKTILLLDACVVHFGHVRVRWIIYASIVCVVWVLLHKGWHHRLAIRREWYYMPLCHGGSLFRAIGFWLQYIVRYYCDCHGQCLKMRMVIGHNHILFISWRHFIILLNYGRRWRWWNSLEWPLTNDNDDDDHDDDGSKETTPLPRTRIDAIESISKLHERHFHSHRIDEEDIPDQVCRFMIASENVLYIAQWYMLSTHS